MKPEDDTVGTMSNGRTKRFMDEVKRYLEANRIAQVDFAKMIGKSPQLVNDWFNGRKFPVSEQVLHIQEIMREKS